MTSDLNDQSEPPTNDSSNTDVDTMIPMPDPIYISEDLCRGRAQLAHKVRMVKLAGGINDTWTFDGFILVKDLQNKIRKLSRRADLL